MIMLQHWASSKLKSYQIAEPQVSKQEKVKHNMENIGWLNWMVIKLTIFQVNILPL